ncbi:MAG: T9SS type A sorting domain-containing protein [Bacteroidia bacterium]
MKSFRNLCTAFLVICLMHGIGLSQPVVNLGADTLVCGGLTLDAGNAGASYLWSTGDISQTIFADTSGIFWVDVTDANGTTRDSISLVVVPSPSLAGLQDTILCGGDVMLIPNYFGSDRLVWYDSLTGGNVVHIGDTLSGAFTDTSNYFLSAVNVDTSITVGASLINNGSFAGLRGLRFDADQAFILESVTVGLNGPADFTIYRTNARAAPVDSIVVSVTPDANGMAVIPLFLSIPKGDDFRLLAGNFKQGSLNLRRNNLSFPYTIPGILEIERGISVSSIYYYFFDWKVSTLACATPRQAYNANILPTPTVDLGPDTIVCGGPYILDATFPNAMYDWSTSETTAIISVDTLAEYSVTVSLGTCLALDTVNVEFVEEPGLPIITDTTMCGPATIPLIASKVGEGKVLWYDAAVDGRLIGIGEQGLSIDVQDDTTVYATTRTIAEYPFKVGTNQVPTGYFAGRRGLEFDVMEKLIIEEVVMYAQVPTSMTIYLLDRTGSILDSALASSPSVTGIGVPFSISLGFEVEPGTRYQLMADNITGGSLGILNPGPQFPLSYPGVMEITQGVTLPGNYYYFFDWTIAKATCEGVRVPKQISVALPLNLPETLYACEDTLIQANIQAASFLWNTNDATPDLRVDSTGQYILTVSDGLDCTVSDTVAFTQALPAGLGADGILCGNELITNYGSDAIFDWSTTDTTPTITVNTPGQYSVIIQEPRGCVIVDTINITGFTTFPSVSLGRDKNVCIQDTLDAGNAGASFLWSTQDTSQTIVVNATGFYSVAVTNSAGCTSVDTIAVTVTPRPTADFTSTLNGFEACFFNFSSFPTSPYQWNFGDGNSSNDIQPCHTYVDTGTYVVRLIVINQCGTDTLYDTLVVRRPDGLDNSLNNLNISCYPNPATQLLHIEIPGTSLQKATTISMVTLQGKVCLQKVTQGSSQTTLDINDLSPGMYFLRARQGDSYGIIKVHIVR